MWQRSRNIDFNEDDVPSWCSGLQGHTEATLKWYFSTHLMGAENHNWKSFSVSFSSLPLSGCRWCTLCSTWSILWFRASSGTSTLSSKKQRRVWIGTAKVRTLTDNYQMQLLRNDTFECLIFYCQRVCQPKRQKNYFHLHLVVSSHAHSLWPGFEMFVSEMSAFTPVQWRWIELHLWRSQHQNITATCLPADLTAHSFQWTYWRNSPTWKVLTGCLTLDERNSSTFQQMCLFAFLLSVRWEDQYQSRVCASSTQGLETKEKALDVLPAPQ